METKTTKATAVGLALGAALGAILAFRFANKQRKAQENASSQVKKTTTPPTSPSPSTTDPNTSRRPLVLVTGGSGLLGSAFQRVAAEDYSDIDFHFSRSSECNLLNETAVQALFEKLKPTHVIHLAADVGGLYKNMNQQFNMFSNNVRMNMNVIETAHRCGVQHLVACLSTCVFPDEIAASGQPLKEEDLHKGPPHDSNYGYAYAKRMVEVACRALREQQARNYFCITPTNLYGPHDNFNLKDAHVMPALIHKAFLAKRKGEKLMVFGTGAPLRQFLLADDCAAFTLYCLFRYRGAPLDSVIVSVPPGAEITIAHAANSIASYFGVETYYDRTKSDGQLRKTASNERMEKLFGGPFPYTPFQEGLKGAIDWFVENYDTNVRR